MLELHRVVQRKQSIIYTLTFAYLKERRQYLMFWNFATFQYWFDLPQVK